jgi:hypothetical protein
MGIPLLLLCKNYVFNIMPNPLFSQVYNEKQGVTDQNITIESKGHVPIDNKKDVPQ